MKFDLHSEFSPQGDQPKAINQLVNGLKNNEKHQVLLGVTGYSIYTAFGPVSKELRDPFEEHED